MDFLQKKKTIAIYLQVARVYCGGYMQSKEGPPKKQLFLNSFR